MGRCAAGDGGRRRTGLNADPAAQPLADALRHVSACLQAGEPLLAANACERLATIAPDDAALFRSWALALARSGAASKANALMERLAAQGLPSALASSSLSMTRRGREFIRTARQVAV